MVKESGFEFTKLLYPFNQENALRIEVGKHSMEEYVAYINEHQIEQAWIAMPDLNFLLKCPSLKYLRIGMPTAKTKNYDFSPLYKLAEVRSLDIVNEVCILNLMDMEDISETDYSRIKGIVSLSITANRGSLNYEAISTLKSLTIGGFSNKSKDLQGMFTSKQLDTLSLLECKEHSLDGIETSEKLQCLYISYNRALSDISALRKVKHSLKALQIHNCPKIEDFSVLGELTNLESLIIIGNNKLPDLIFLKELKKLTRFVFDVTIVNGDLTPCLDISFVGCARHKRNYNLKAKDLPKGPFLRGNEDIEEWRRLE